VLRLPSPSETAAAPGTEATLFLQGKEDPHSNSQEKPIYFPDLRLRSSSVEAPLSIGDSSRPRPRKKPSGGFPLDGQGSSRADDGEAAHGHGNSLQRLLSLRRVASTIRQRELIRITPHSNSQEKPIYFPDLRLRSLKPYL